MSDNEVYEYLGEVFEWNRAKALKNAMHHGVRFTEAVQIFFDGDALYQQDEEHSDDEQRYTVIGRSLSQHTLFVVHVVRGKKVRIISARKAEPDERRDYEKQLGR